MSNKPKRRYRLGGAKRFPPKLSTATRGTGTVIAIEGDSDRCWISLAPREGRLWFSLRFAWRESDPPPCVGDTVNYAEIAGTIRKAALV
jgi:hypothetical protein